jgi:tyrosyl-tRNA synthetase
MAYAKTRHGAVQKDHFLPVVESNLKWHSQLTMLDFLQSVGIHARVNTMLNRERCESMRFPSINLSHAIWIACEHG